MAYKFHSRLPNERRAATALATACDALEALWRYGTDECADEALAALTILNPKAALVETAGGHRALSGASESDLAETNGVLLTALLAARDALAQCRAHPAMLDAILHDTDRALGKAGHDPKADAAER